MIEIVLRDTDELGISAVWRLGNQRLIQPAFGEVPHRASEIVVELFQTGDCVSPVLWRRRRNGRPILGGPELPPIAAEST